MMDETPDDLGLTLLDDGDAAGPTKRRPRIPLELLLGAAILLAIVGWGALDWWTGQRGLEDYRLAQAAAARQDWDAALDYYRSAGGYADAAKQADDTAKVVAERNDYYLAAVRFAVAAKWLSALEALQHVAAIQPDYRDIEERYQFALAGAAADALTGAIAARPQATPPGLYVYTLDGWQWLEGSDARSIVRVAGSCAGVVYDVPDPQALAQPPDASAPFAQGGDQLPAGRLLMVARLAEGKLQTQALSFKSGEFQNYVCSASGILAVAAGAEAGLYRYAFQDFAAAKAVALKPPDKAILVAESLRHDHLIYYIPGIDQYNSPTVTYYALDLASGAWQPLIGLSGQHKSVTVSPDGSQMLVTLNTQQLSGADRHNIYLVDLTDPPTMFSLGSWVSSLSYGEAPEYEARFVPGGRFAGKILMTGSQSSASSAWLLDNRSRGKVLWRGAIVDRNLRAEVTSFGDGMLVTWVTGYCNAVGNPTYVNADYQAMELDLGVPSSQWIEQPLERQGQLVYMTASRCATGDIGVSSTSPLALAGSTQAVVPLFNLERSGLSYSYLVDQFSIGPHLLAYIQDGELHARGYDGQQDALLEKGVTSMFNATRFYVP